MHCGLVLAGQLDAASQQEAIQALCLVDWERTKRIEFDNRFRSLKEPLETLDCANGCLYAMQLNIYAYILESEYGYSVAKMYLAQVHPSLNRPRLIDVPKLQLHVDLVVEDQIERGLAVAAARPGEFARFELPTPLHNRVSETLSGKAARTTYPLGLGQLPERAVDICLSFVLAPLLMCTLCAVSRRFLDACWRPTAWSDTLVDAGQNRPHGLQAHEHHTLWWRAVGVVCRPCAFGSVCFHIFYGWRPWHWAHTAVKKAKWYQPSRRVT